MGNFQRLFLRWLFWSLRLAMIWFSVEELLARRICTTSFFVATYGGGCISSLRISTNWLRTTCSCCCCSSSRAVPSFSSTSGSWLRRRGFHHRRPVFTRQMNIRWWRMLCQLVIRLYIIWSGVASDPVDILLPEELDIGGSLLLYHQIPFGFAAMFWFAVQYPL